MGEEESRYGERVITVCEMRKEMRTSEDRVKK